METSIDTLLDLLIANGGSIVSSNDCSVLEISLAQACGRFCVDDDGMGFVYRPPLKIKE
jgi:hypothetical protein